MHSRQHISSHVLHRLKFLNINFGHSSQRRVAVVKPTVNKSLYKRMENLTSQGAHKRVQRPSPGCWCRWCFLPSTTTFWSFVLSISLAFVVVSSSHLVCICRTRHFKFCMQEAHHHGSFYALCLKVLYWVRVCSSDAWLTLQMRFQLMMSTRGWPNFLFIFTARRVCIGWTMPWQDVCLSVRLSVCLSHAGIESKWLYISSNGGVECKGGMKNSWFSTNIFALSRKRCKIEP